MLPDTVARSGYMLNVSLRHNYYSFMSRSTCIPLYPATDGRQTGNNFVADTINMLTATSGYKWIQRVSDIVSGCKRGFILLVISAQVMRLLGDRMQFYPVEHLYKQYTQSYKIINSKQSDLRKSIITSTSCVALTDRKCKVSYSTRAYRRGLSSLS